MEIKDLKPKSFWERPEGTTGMLFGAVALIGGGILLYSKLLPFLLTLAWGTFQIVVAGLSTAAIIYVIADARFRNLLLFSYKSAMRLATGVFVTIDPIGIIEGYVDTLKDNLKKISKQIMNLRGQVEMLNSQISTNQKQMKQNIQLVQAAKDNQKYAMNAKLAVRSSGRLSESNKTLQELLVKLEGLYRVLNKTYEAADFLVKDIEDDVQIKKRERQAVLAGHSAIKSAMKIIKPEDDKKAMFDAALEYMAEDIGSKVGDIEHFIEVSESFMNGVDLQNGIFEKEGWELLEQWEKQGSPLLHSDKETLLARANDENDVLDLDNPIEKAKVPRPNQFDKLFK